MKNWFIYLLLLLILSCQSADKTKKPDKLLDQDKMVAILSDIAMLKAANDVNGNRLSKFIENPFTYVTKKYDVDSVTIVRNIEYYNFQFNENLSIYEQVEENIIDRKQKIDSIHKIIDSLKRKDSSKQKIK